MTRRDQSRRLPTRHTVNALSNTWPCQASRAPFGQDGRHWPNTGEAPQPTPPPPIVSGGHARAAVGISHQGGMSHTRHGTADVGDKDKTPGVKARHPRINARTQESEEKAVAPVNRTENQQIASTSHTNTRRRIGPAWCQPGGLGGNGKAGKGHRHRCVDPTVMNGKPTCVC